MQTRLTDAPGYDGGPFFNADGDPKIVWRRFTEDGDDRGRVDDEPRRRPSSEQITDFESMSWAPYTHPSGEYIFFASNKLGFTNFEVYLVDEAGRKDPVRVTYTDGFDGLPVPSPDGHQVRVDIERVSSASEARDRSSSPSGTTRKPWRRSRAAPERGTLRRTSPQ